MRPLDLTVQASAPLGSAKGRYLSAGAALRSGATGVIVERRIALDDGSRGSTAITGYGGFYGVALPARFLLDGYVQGGIVGPQGFIEGGLRAERVVLEARRARLALGGGLSGGAQTGVARLDIGPQIVARLPMGSASVRLTAEWRERVAGNAVPGSGPVVTAGIDF